MILTRENIHAGTSESCGFNRRQLEVLGVSWPPVHGWLENLIGKNIPDAAYQEFLSLQGVKGGTKRATQILRDRQTPTML